MDWNQIILAVVGTFVAWALGMLGRWLASKTNNERLRVVIRLGIDAATDAVAAVQQTMVDALKAGGGKLTQEQKDQAFASALAATKQILGTKGLEALESALDFGKEEAEQWLTHQIEAAVQAAKVKS